ncbi:MAG TPA: hypothetical protein VNF99_16850 [Stellaceae bacterium]|nr:hypothetical protein [Stellaceae bacterium]
MSEPLRAAELAPADLAQALPLLRVTWSKLDLPAWQTFAANFCGQDRAEARITGLFDSGGGLCGLLASRIDHTLDGGRILAIPVFTAVDIANSLAPVRALLDLAQAKMNEHGCGSLQIHLVSTQGELVKRLRAFGLRHSGSHYSATADAAASKLNA